MKPSFLKMDDEGREIPDDTPVVIRINGTTISEFDQVRAFIRRELREHQNGELETFEDANDFDVDDDLFPVGVAEYAEDTEAADREVLELEKARRDALAKQSRQDSFAALTSGNPNGGTGGVPPVSAPEPPRAPPSEAPTK